MGYRYLLGKARRHDGRLAAQNIFGRRLFELGIPHQADAVGIIRGIEIIVIRGDEQFGELRGPVHGGDAPVFRPALVGEAPVRT